MHVFPSFEGSSPDSDESRDEPSTARGCRGESSGCLSAEYLRERRTADESSGRPDAIGTDGHYTGRNIAPECPTGFVAIANGLCETLVAKDTLWAGNLLMMVSGFHVASFFHRL